MSSSSNNSTTIELLETHRTYELYELHFHNRTYGTTVTNNPHIVTEWLHTMKAIYTNVLPTAPLLFGLDFKFRHKPNHSLATLHLCTLERCLVFQLLHTSHIPDSLREFLTDPGNTFVGIGVKPGVEILEKEYDVGKDVVDENDGCVVNVVELGELAECRYGKGELRGFGVERLCRFVLGKGVEKPGWVGSSAWENRRLSSNQVKFASVDAVVVYQIGVTLCAHDLGADWSDPVGDRSERIVRISETNRPSPSCCCTIRRKPNPLNHETEKLTNDVETVSYDIMCISKVRTTVTNDPSLVDEWISHSESISKDLLVFGVDVQWRPPFASGHHNPVATLQICIKERCLIFQIIHSSYVPDSLKDFLANKAYTFVGVGVKSNLEKLERDYQIGKNTKVVDLGNLAVHRYATKDLENYELKDLYKHVFGKEIKKPLLVASSDWDNRRLTTDQVNYACNVAALSYEIGAKLRADDLDLKLNMLQSPIVPSKGLIIRLTSTQVNVDL